MLRLPAVAGRFYPSDPAELRALVHKYAKADAAKAETAKTEAATK